MKKIKQNKHKEKSVSGGIRNTFRRNQFDALGGNSNGLSAFNYAENADKLQCQKCHPPLVKPRGAVKLCADCEAETEQTSKTFFDNFRRHRKVVPLDRFCDNCEKPKTAAMMSKRFSICRQCADKLKSTTGAAQNRIIARILNNTHKRLKAVALRWAETLPTQVDNFVVDSKYNF